MIFARIWPFLLMATATVWVGASALTRVDLDLLSSLLGFLLIVYATISLAGLRLIISAGNDAWAGPAFGIANGVLIGMTGSFVVTGVMFLQAIGLSRDMLIQVWACSSQGRQSHSPSRFRTTACSPVPRQRPPLAHHADVRVADDLPAVTADFARLRWRCISATTSQSYAEEATLGE